MKFLFPIAIALVSLASFAGSDCSVYIQSNIDEYWVRSSTSLRRSHVRVAEIALTKKGYDVTKSAEEARFFLMLNHIDAGKLNSLAPTSTALIQLVDVKEAQMNDYEGKSRYSWFGPLNILTGTTKDVVGGENTSIKRAIKKMPDCRDS